MSNKKEFFNKLADLLEEYGLYIECDGYDGEMGVFEKWDKRLLSGDEYEFTLDAETCRKIAEE